jgi:hypothetical protein
MASPENASKGHAQTEICLSGKGLDMAQTASNISPSP